MSAHIIAGRRQIVNPGGGGGFVERPERFLVTYQDVKSQKTEPKTSALHKLSKIAKHVRNDPKDFPLRTLRLCGSRLFSLSPPGSLRV
jgi:hypothetical protein